MTVNLCKVSQICTGNLGYNRIQMPQIKHKDLKKFLKFIRKTNKVKKKKIKPSKLKSTQNQISQKAIRKIQQQIIHNKYKNNPILISKDNYILDGHHRWATFRDCEIKPKNCNYKTKNKKIPGYQINMPIKNLLKKTHTFEKVGYTGIH